MTDISRKPMIPPAKFRKVEKMKPAEYQKFVNERIVPPGDLSIQDVFRIGRAKNRVLGKRK